MTEQQLRKSWAAGVADTPCKAGGRVGRGSQPDVCFVSCRKTKCVWRLMLVAQPPGRFAGL